METKTPKAMKKTTAQIVAELKQWNENQPAIRASLVKDLLFK